MNFMRQMDEIYFIIGVKKYTNGIDFHCFHGGKFLPCQIVSDTLLLQPFDFQPLQSHIPLRK